MGSRSAGASGRYIGSDDFLSVSYFVRAHRAQLDHGQAVADAHGYTCIHVRYNSGLAIADDDVPPTTGNVQWQFCANGVRTPVLFLSALGEINDRVEGLKAGEFDFMREFISRNWARQYRGKAFDSGELVKRAFENRNPARASEVIGLWPKSGREDVDRAVAASISSSRTYIVGTPKKSVGWKSRNSASAVTSSVHPPQALAKRADVMTTLEVRSARRVVITGTCRCAERCKRTESDSRRS